MCLKLKINCIKLSFLFKDALVTSSHVLIFFFITIKLTYCRKNWREFSEKELKAHIHLPLEINTSKTMIYCLLVSILKKKNLYFSHDEFTFRTCDSETVVQHSVILVFTFLFKST